MGKEGVGIQVRVRVSVLTAGLVYHKPPSCQYYDRSEMGYRELRSRDFRGRTTLGPQGRGRERDSLLVLRTSVGREEVVGADSVRECQSISGGREREVMALGHRSWESRL